MAYVDSRNARWSAGPAAWVRDSGPARVQPFSYPSLDPPSHPFAACSMIAAMLVRSMNAISFSVRCIVLRPIFVGRGSPRRVHASSAP